MDEEQTYKQPRIRGSAGGLDYTVVAKNGDVVLGLKMVTRPAHNYQTGKTNVFVGFRVRSAYGEDVVNESDLPEGKLVDAWHGMEFEEVGTTNYGMRARTHVGMLLNKRPSQMAYVIQALEEVRFYAKIMAWLQTYTVGLAQFTLSYDEFCEAMEEQAQALFGHLSPEAVEDEDESSEVDFQQALMEKIAMHTEPAEDAGDDCDEGDCQGCADCNDEPTAN